MTGIMRRLVRCWLPTHVAIMRVSRRLCKRIELGRNAATVQ